jgi:hypothetical protein
MKPSSAWKLKIPTPLVLVLVVSHFHLDLANLDRHTYPLIQSPWAIITCGVTAERAGAGGLRVCVCGAGAK